MNRYEALKVDWEIINELAEYNVGHTSAISKEALSLLGELTFPETDLYLGKLNPDEIIIPGTFSRSPQGYDALVEEAVPGDFKLRIIKVVVTP